MDLKKYQTNLNVNITRFSEMVKHDLKLVVSNKDDSINDCSSEDPKKPVNMNKMVVAGLSGEFHRIKLKSSKDQESSDQQTTKHKSCNIDENHLKKFAHSMYLKCLQKKSYKANNIQTWFLSEGAFGAVFRVEDVSGTVYACKIISNIKFKLKKDKYPNMTTAKMRSRFYNEVNIMRKVSNHPNIITLIDCFEVDSRCTIKNSAKQDLTIDHNNCGTNLKLTNCFIVMEYADSRTLSEHLKNQRALNENMAKEIFAQLIDAVHYMHKKRIAHRDIKLSNILLQLKPQTSAGKWLIKRSLANNHHHHFHYVIKLCDFGLSSMMDETNPLEEEMGAVAGDDEEEEETNMANGRFWKPVGTSLYMSPEILRAYYFYYKKRDPQRIYPYCPFKGDVWAIGVAMYYCLHGSYPLTLLCNNDKMARLKALKRVFEKADDSSSNVHLSETDYIKSYCRDIRKELRKYDQSLSVNCRDVLSRMLYVEPGKRANIDEIYQHAYFRNLPFKFDL